MIGFSFLHSGLSALARCHVAGTMAGHLGAAVLAGYFIGEDHSSLPEKVSDGIEAELRRIIAGEEKIWFNARKAGVTPTELFELLPQRERVAGGPARIAKALEASIDGLRQSGHHVIFASIAIRALHDHPEFASREVVDGLVKLMAAFVRTSQGRGYFGQQVGWKSGEQVVIKAAANVEPPKSIEAMIAATIDELISSASQHKRGFGGLWHVVNHAAGLCELANYGFRKLALRGLKAQHWHLQLYQQLPDLTEELGAVSQAMHDPFQIDYWKERLRRSEALLTHRVKTIYGFHTILPFVKDAGKQQAARQAFRYLMN